MGDDAVSETRATYDRITDQYAARSLTPDPGFSSSRAAFASRLPAGALVADVGCGPGQDAEHFTGLGLRAVAVDGSAGMVELARARGLAAVRADLRALPFGDEVLDGLWSSASLLHVPREDVPATLAGWRRVMRPGAALGLSTALGEADGWEDVHYAHAPGPDGRPLRRWFVRHRRADLLDLLRAAGFEVLDATERTTHRHWLHVTARAV